MIKKKSDLLMGVSVIMSCCLFTLWFWWLDISPTLLFILRLSGYFSGLILIVVFFGFLTMGLERDK